MAVLITINGVNYFAPEVGTTGWGDNVNSILSALGSGLLQKVVGAVGTTQNFSLGGPVNFGTNYGIIIKSITSTSSNTAATGVVRLAAGDTINWNYGGTDNTLTVDSNRNLLYRGQVVMTADNMENLLNKTLQSCIIDADLNTLTNVRNANIASDAAIAQSKIDGLVSDLAGKEPTVTKGDITSSTDGVNITGGTDAVIGSGVTVDIDTADATHNGLLSKEDYVRFSSAAPETPKDITSNTSGVTVTGGEGSVISTTDVSIDVEVATGAQQGLLSAADWTTFNGKQDALGFTPVDKAGDTMTGLLSLDNEGIQFDTVGSPTATPEGRVWWDLADHTLAIKPDITNATLQVGQEMWLRVRNQTGSTILDGTVVYVSGSTGSRPQITKAQANSDATADKVIGVVTADIGSPADGFVTTFGLVRGLNTSVDSAGAALSDGDVLYLSATVAGGLVKTKPTYPNVSVVVGHVIYAHNSNGIILVSPDTGAHLSDLHDTSISNPSTNQVVKYDGTKWVNAQLDHTVLGSIGSNSHAQIDAFMLNNDTVHTVMKEPTGFEDPDNIGVAYDSAARTITLTHSSGTIAYWINNVRHTRVSPYTSPAHTNTTGQNYYFTFATGDSPTWTTSFPGFDDGAYCAFVYYGATDKFAIRECHGLMDWRVWRNLHNNVGTYRTSGAVVAGLAGGGSNQSDMQPTVTASTVMDEDLATTISAISVKGTYMRAYVNNGAVTFSSGANIFFDDATNPQYNANPASGTALVSITVNNTYFNVYGILVPVTSDAGSQAYRTIWLTGQATYTSLTNAQAEDFRTLNLGDLTNVFTEFVPYIRISLYRSTGGYRNTRAGGVTATSAVTYLIGTKAAYVNVTGIVSTPPLASRYDTALSWTGVGPYTMTIAQSTHLKGADPLVRVRELTTGTSYVDVYPEIVVDRSTGDVTITSTESITGIVVIM